MGGLEIGLIFLVYLMLFGSKGVPSLAQNLGKAMRTFRDATSDIQREIISSANEIKQEANKSVKGQRARHESLQAPSSKPPVPPNDTTLDQPSDGGSTPPKNTNH